MVFTLHCYAQEERAGFEDANKEYFYLGSTLEMKDRFSFTPSPESKIFTLNKSSRFMAIITSSGPASICPGQTVVLTGNGGSGYTYLWTTGQTTKTISVNQPGVYGLTIFCSKCKNGPYVANPITINSNTLKTDLNKSGVTDVLDYMIFLGKFNTLCPGCPEDFNLDGAVDVRDYLMWVADISKICN